MINHTDGSDSGQVDVGGDGRPYSAVNANSRLTASRLLTASKRLDTPSSSPDDHISPAAAAARGRRTDSCCSRSAVDVAASLDSM